VTTSLSLSKINSKSKSAVRALQQTTVGITAFFRFPIADTHYIYIQIIQDLHI